MSLLKVFGSPWAITAEKFTEIQEVYQRHLHSEKLDIAAIKAKTGDKTRKEQGFQILDDVAIIPIEGVIAKKMNLFSEISGGASTQLIERDFKLAMEHRAVKSILLAIDSPGGAVDGTPELANAIFEARGKKPIIAFSDGIMASAAFWIGAAADQVFISGRTVEVGSIGVVATHTDVSKMEEKAGVKTTEIVAGKFKRIASQHEPLTKEGRASIQEMVDDVFSVFVSDVAKFRGVSEETVLSNMADGRVFMGKKALKAGLVDGIMTQDKVISKMAAGESPGFQIIVKKEVGYMEITKELISEKHPGIAKAFVKEGFDAGKLESAKEFNDGHDEGVQAGAEAERKRIQGVEAQSIPGHEALIAGMKFDGKTTGPEAAVEVLKAEKSLRAKVAGNIVKDAGAAVAATEPTEPVKKENLDAKGDRLIKEYMAANECDYREALLAVSSENPDLFEDLKGQ